MKDAINIENKGDIIMSDFRKKVEEDWESYKKDKSKELYPNILLMGISGAGKSSLINFELILQRFLI